MRVSQPVLLTDPERQQGRGRGERQTEGEEEGNEKEAPLYPFPLFNYFSPSSVCIVTGSRGSWGQKKNIPSNNNLKWRREEGWKERKKWNSRG
uniref:Uncharacterized protein n=1 Tax=Anguilla anguilla TaxID=7936 RepID=A0A0E9RLX5_ANGAN